MDAAAFDAEIKAMRQYRDKFVAHLDDLPVMDIPMLESAKSAIWFYHGHVVTAEAKDGELAGFLATTTDNFTRGYEACLMAAGAVYSIALESPPV